MPSNKLADMKVSNQFSFADGANQVFERGLRECFEYRDLGIGEASGGALLAHHIRAVPSAAGGFSWHKHILGFQMFYVLKGWLEFEYEGVGRRRFVAGSCVYQPPGIAHREIAHSDDAEVLEITSPAKFETLVVESVGV
jgi:mannose-6-phosphate isomerase-like protein (cupin superfamily)